MALRPTWYVLGMGRAFIRACLWKMRKKYNIYRGSLNLYSSLGIFGPLKIFYGQKVADMYIRNKEAILENGYVKN